jgi:hypothetical protein
MAAKVACDPSVSHHTGLVLNQVERGLLAAEDAMLVKPNWRDAWHGSRIDAVYGYLHVADAELIQVECNLLLPVRQEEVLVQVRQHLNRTDPRRLAVENQIAESRHPSVSPTVDGRVLSLGLLAAYNASDTAHRRLRGFRNSLLVSVLILCFMAALLAIAGAIWPAATSLCFGTGSAGTCPTGIGQPSKGDTALVLLAGLIGSAVASIAALRDGHGTEAPYRFPLLLLLLKLPLGMLTAWLGLLLVHGEFIPGLTALDTPGQIIAWAAVFGAGQQAVSRYVDRRADVALDDTHGPSSARRAQSGSVDHTRRTGDTPSA